MLRQPCFLLKNSIRSPYYQTARWNRPRKPFWLGIAKSKMFVIREPNVVPKEEPERSEFLKLKRIHSTFLKSLLHFIRHENPLADEATSMTTIQDQDALNLQMEKSLVRNEKWNLESERLRSERLKASDPLDIALAKAVRIDEKTRQLNAAVEEIVKNEIEASQSYITLENLDEAIEKCLEKEVEYNFAIDIHGNKFLGQGVYEESDFQEQNLGTNKNEHN